MSEVVGDTARKLFRRRYLVFDFNTHHPEAFKGGRFEFFRSTPSEILRYRADHVFTGRIGRLRVRDEVSRRRLLALAMVAVAKEQRESTDRVFYDVSSSYPTSMLRGAP